MIRPNGIESLLLSLLLELLLLVLMVEVGEEVFHARFCQSLDENLRAVDRLTSMDGTGLSINVRCFLILVSSRLLPLVSDRSKRVSLFVQDIVTPGAG